MSEWLHSREGVKETVSWDDVATRVPQLLDQMQVEMLASATARYQACIEKVSTYNW
jgi:hypothetical protein